MIRSVARPAVLPGWVFAFVSLLSIAGCGTEPAHEIRNVVLITVDTLRADFLGCYGHPSIQTPNVDRLSREGFRFERAYAQSHITLPSHVSILTSLYPKDHGVNRNDPYRVDPDISTLADVLKESDYRTVAVTSNRILGPQHLVGLGRGFDTFDVPDDPERQGSVTNAAFFARLMGNEGERFFAWLHYFDAHLPYEPPAEYRSRYYEGDPKDTRFTSMERVVFPWAWTNPKHWSNRLIAWLDGIRDFEYAVSQYAGEVSYVDAMIGEVMEKLAALGLDGDTLVVFTADHGESLGEHEIYLGHLALYEPSTHVPLIFWAPSRIRPPRSSAALAMSVDIMPTILDLLRVEKRPKRMKGRSLVPLMDGVSAEEPHQYAFAEREDQTQVMVRTRDWKYIKTLKPVWVTQRFGAAPGQKELYNVAKDPAETVNLSESEPERVAEFERTLAVWLESDDPPRPDGSTGQPADYLKALGYAE
jgi:arylsulfatase A-like enzyme